MGLPDSFGGLLDAQPTSSFVNMGTYISPITVSEIEAGSKSMLTFIGHVRSCKVIHIFNCIIFTVVSSSESYTKVTNINKH